MYANCPIYWRSSLQTENALSTAEAEYIALSSALRQVLPLMTMMEEIDTVFPLILTNLILYAKCMKITNLALKWQQVSSSRQELNILH